MFMKNILLIFSFVAWVQGASACTPTAFPIDLFLGGSPPREKTATFCVSKPSGVTNASIVLTAYDADQPNEGRLFINGNGPLKLFGSQGVGSNDVKTVSVTYSTSADWWNDGSNTLRFMHDSTAGYRINGISVSFNGAPPPPPPPPPPPSESSDVPTPTQIAPIVGVKSFGAKGNGIADDTTAIKNAIKSMTNGGTLVFPPGTYNYSSFILIDKAGVKLWGYGGARLHNTTAPDIASIRLRANNTAIYGFKLTGSLTKRAQDANYQITLGTGSNQEVIDNELTGQNGKLGGGILMTTGTVDCLIARNSVSDSPADSIRATKGTRDCRILENVVRNAGDDMISVVSVFTSPISTNILIGNNDVQGQYWGRGITVVGGEKVTIRNNIVSDTSHAAGMYFAQENDFNTHPTRNILVEGNTIMHVQTTGTPKNNKKTGHGGINMHGEDSAKGVKDVLIRNNTIDDVIDDGIRIQSKVCRVGLVDNTMTHIPGKAIDLSSSIGGSCNVACSGNTDEGKPVSNSQCGGPIPTVTGYTP